MKKSVFEINNEHRIIRYGNGIKVAKPSTSAQLANNGFEFELPLLCYFYDHNNTFLQINDVATCVNGFISKKDAIGKTMRAVVDKESSDRIFANNNIVTRTHTMQILEESIFRKDGIYLEGISIKCPWYNETNKVIGIFGCSFVIDSLSSYKNALSILANTGLLNLSHSALHDENIYFSRRQKEVLYHLVRGKSAGQIAEHLALSKRTVEQYLENIKNKTGTNSKAELIDKVFHHYLDII